MAKVMVTGVAGCIGAWVARHLLHDGHAICGLDIAAQTPRLRLLGIEGAFPVLAVDIRDHAALEAAVQRQRPDAIIHLAALQIPICKPNPLQCVQINVGAVLGLLELARGGAFSLTYASSAAVYGPDPGRALGENEGIAPQTLYGVFKRTDEEMARVYWQDYGVRSVGFRPYVVYGPGRDVGVTSDVTVALWHAFRGERFRIRFGGTVALQHASDVARAFIRAGLAPAAGAAVYNLRGSMADMPEIVRLIHAVTGTEGLITADAAPLPIAFDLSEARFQQDYGPFEYMDLETGFRRTVEVWRAAS
jgi:nucleoside-diphosphate-sugar epimerase